MAGGKALGREYRAHRPLILGAGRPAAVIISRRTLDVGHADVEDDVAQIAGAATDNRQAP